MAGTLEISPSEWRGFFSSLSEQHEDEPVAVEVVGSDIGAQVEGRGLLMRGISPARSEEESDLALMLESADGSHLTHMIPRPVHVWLLRTRSNADEALEIQSADGTKTLIHFAPSAI